MYRARLMHWFANGWQEYCFSGARRTQENSKVTRSQKDKTNGLNHKEHEEHQEKSLFQGFSMAFVFLVIFVVVLLFRGGRHPGMTDDHLLNFDPTAAAGIVGLACGPAA